METMKPRAAAASASQRAKGAFLSLPVASTARPPRIGTQITRLRGGNPNIFFFLKPWL
jgi:hypothetical protein